MRLRNEAIDAMWQALQGLSDTTTHEDLADALDGLLDWLSTTIPEPLSVWALVDLLRGQNDE